MSVINQMLKDLDKRQESAPSSQAQTPVVVQTSQSSFTPVILAVIITLIIVAAVYLYIENQSLKSSAQLPVAQPQLSQTQLTAEQVKLAPASEVKTDVVDIERVKTEPVKAAQKSDDAVIANSAKEEIAQVNQVSEEIELAAAEQTITAPQLTKKSLTNKKSLAENTAAADEMTVPEQKAPNKPVLSIARKQLTPEQLASKKMKQAQDAMLDNKGEQAEQLLEEVLLVTPENHAARKQLAALWYGRKSLQPALNLLSQGLAIDSEQYEFRLMQAKIYADMQNTQQALLVLAQSIDTPNFEYQSLMATLAQKANNNELALKALTNLINLEPYQGRWHLALAVTHDKLGQYQHASVSYHQAIRLGNLSDSALSFAKQRSKELGAQ